MFSVRSPKPRKAATLADLREVWDLKSVELIAGEIVEKASPGFFHGNTQGAVFSILWTRFGGGGDGGEKATWWFASEVDVRFDAHDVFRPDVAGWRRDRVPEPPAERPVRVRPDWVCEVLSTSDKRRDQVLKLRVYHRHAVPHYWLLDPEEKTLTVYRWQADGYVNALTAAAGERVRAEPFDALEFPLGALFGEETPPKRRPRGPKR
jgi:Uma2 family endonuclease